LAGDIHARLGHDPNGVGIQSMGFDPRRIRLDLVRFQVASPTLGHLAATGIARAKKQNF
jgi:hypothetical protein